MTHVHRLTDVMKLLRPKMVKNAGKLLILTLFFGMLFENPVYAEDNEADLQAIRQELSRLRQQNPEAFEQELMRIKSQIRDDVNQLKSERSPAFSQFISERERMAQERMKNLKETNPDKYRWLQDVRQRQFEKTVAEIGKQDPDSLRLIGTHNKGFGRWANQNPRVRNLFDSDADGKLSREEIMAAKQDLRDFNIDQARIKRENSSPPPQRIRQREIKENPGTHLKQKEELKRHLRQDRI